MRKNKTISITLSEELCSKLQQLAAESCRSRTAYIRQIIKRYLRSVEHDPKCKIP